jgi:hypothetical protein
VPAKSGHPGYLRKHGGGAPSRRGKIWRRDEDHTRTLVTHAKRSGAAAAWDVGARGW